MKWFVFLCGCTTTPALPHVSGFVGDANAVDVTGPITLHCTPTCAGGTTATAHSAEGDIDVSFVAQNGAWIGTPKTRFAYARQYSLALPTTVAAPVLDFQTVPDPSALPSVSVWPDPAALLPNDAAWIVLHFSPPVARQGVLDLVLASGDIQVAPKWIDLAGGALISEAILWGRFNDSRCSENMESQLCANAQYILRSISGLYAPGGAYLMDVTSFVAGPALQGAPAWQDDGAFAYNDIAARLTRGVDRPCLLQAADANASGPDFPVDFSSGSVLFSGLSPATSYAWSLVCVDAAGGATSPWPVNFTTPALADIHLSELVPTPLQDWNDSSGANGVPFDDQPGPVAHATSSDEFAEIVNTGTSAVDISAWHLTVTDTDTSDEVLGDLWQKKPIHAFGVLPLPPAARAVVSMSPSDKNATASATISLVDDLGVTRESIALGQNNVPLGDGVDPAHESVSLCNAGWILTSATPGDANACP